MPDRTLNWGDGASEATYQTGDADSAGGGDFRVVRDTDAGTNLLVYNATDGRFEVVGPVLIDGDTAATLPDLNDTIDLIQVADASSLPDPANVSQPTIAYLEAEDDYAGVFQG